jgi:hypothetical protein
MTYYILLYNELNSGISSTTNLFASYRVNMYVNINVTIWTVNLDYLIMIYMFINGT